MISKLEIDRSSVFLVSGGAKGITAQCVIKLAEYYQCRWILLGRSELLEVEPIWAKDCVAAPELKKRIMQDFLAKGEKPKPIEIERVYKKIASSREIQQTLSTLSQLGSKAEYLSVDVTDAIAVQNSVAAAVDRLGAITGIIHGAGNLADKLIDKKTEADFEKVYSAKVTGLENLLSCVNLDRLDYLILFSSVAGFFGNAGQTDYALANEILNKSAHLVQQNYPSCRVIAINWGPWDSGMVTPQLKKAFAERNIEVIPLEVGAEMLVNEIEAVGQASTQVLIGSPIYSWAEKSTTPLRNYRIRRQLTLEANPFLHDHTIGDRPVLPLTCAASWIGTTCEQLYPGYKFFSLENFKVLKGIVFDGSQADEYILDIKEIDKNELGEIIFEVILWSEIKNRKTKLFQRIHYSSQVKIKSQNIDIPIYENFILTPENQYVNGLDLYKNGTLFHGTCFQGITRILKVNREQLSLQCVVPIVSEKDRGQFGIKSINPYSADALLQSVVVWVRNFENSASLPLEIQKYEQFKLINPGEEYYISADIKKQTKTNAIADVTAHNIKGEIYCRIIDANVTISPQLNRLFISKN